MPNLRFDVSFYDDKQRDLILSHGAAASEVPQIVANGLELTVEEFFSYAVFRYQADSDGFRTRNDLGLFIPRIRGSMFPLFFDLDNGTIASNALGQHETDKDCTETAGVGASLAIASRAFGLHEADWERIAVSQRKDLDFKTMASDGNRFIFVEAKGRVVPSSLTKTDGVWRAKASILGKKRAQRPSPSRDMYLGVIAAFPTAGHEYARCWLVDPYIEAVPDDPRRYKLLCREAFYQRELGTVTQALFRVALANRLQALSLLDDWERFDGRPLINQDGKPFRRPSSMYTSRSTISGDYAFGEAILLNEKEFYFYGFLSEVLDLVLEQSHTRLLEYRARETADVLVNADVLVRAYESDLSAAGINPKSLREVPNSRRREMPMRGSLTVCPSGQVLGVVRP